MPITWFQQRRENARLRDDLAAARRENETLYLDLHEARERAQTAADHLTPIVGDPWSYGSARPSDVERVRKAWETLTGDALIEAPRPVLTAVGDLAEIAVRHGVDGDVLAVQILETLGRKRPRPGDPMPSFPERTLITAAAVETWCGSGWAFALVRFGQYGNPTLVTSDEHGEVWLTSFPYEDEPDIAAGCRFRRWDDVCALPVTVLWDDASAVPVPVEGGAAA